MSVRSLSSALGLVLVSWGLLIVFNGITPILGLGWTGALLVKCASIAVLGGGAGFVVQIWASRDEASAPGVAQYVAVAPFVALVHFANYIGGAPVVSLGVEMIVMGVGAVALHVMLAASMARRDPS